MEYNFLPYFYKERRNKKNTYIVNIIMVTLMIISCILIYRIINVFNETNRLKESIKDINYSKISNKTNYTDKNNEILKNTKYFFQYADKRFEFENLTVENKIINANIILNTKDEYEETVRYIENKSSYWQIIKLSPIQKEAGDIFKFQITLEVKK